MKKLFKIGVVIVLSGLILCVGGLVTLRLMFPPEKIKQMTLEFAKNKLHREVTFDSVSFNLIGVTLTNFALSEEDSFAQGTFVKADRLEAKAALWPLLKKQVEISAIRIDGLDVFIQKNEDGSFNFDTLSNLSSDTSSPTAPAATDTSMQSEAPFTFTARLVKVRDCDFYYKDKQTGVSSSLEDVDVQLANVTMDSPFPVTISFTSQTQDATGLTAQVPVTVGLQVFLAGLSLENAYVEVTQATASYKHIILNLQGKVANLQAPQINLTGTLSGLDNTALTDLLPDLPNFTLPTLHMQLQAAADLDNASATVTNASLRVLDSTLATNGQIGWGGTQPTYRFSGNLHADIGQLVKMTDDTGFDPKGILTAAFTATDKKDNKDISGTITLKNISALYPPFTLSQANGAIKITSLDDISCPSLTGLLNGEKFTASWAYKNIKDVLDIVLDMKLDKLTLTEFPSSPSDSSSTTSAAPADSGSGTPEQTYMNITANVTLGGISIPYFRSEGATLQAALKNVSADMHKTDGTVSFALQPGAITDMETLVKQSKIVRIILLPLGLLNTVGKKLHLNLFEAETQAQKGEIAMTKAQGQYTFTQGVMTINTTTFESALTNLQATGTANFVTNALDMKASATLVTKQTPLVIKIGGTMNDPHGKVDVLNTVTSVVGGILSYKTAKGAVTGASGAASSVASDAAKTTSEAATTAVKDTAKAAKATVQAIGSLFKKKSQPTQTDEQ